MRTIKDVNVKGKKVLLRSEFNVPMKNGIIIDDTRIFKSLDTIKYLVNNGAKLIICAHLWRPKGNIVEELRLTTVWEKLSKLLWIPVKKMNEITWLKVNEAIDSLKEGEIVLLENIRFESQEAIHDSPLSKVLSKYADLFVMDAFWAAHRKHASTFGVAELIPSYAGILMEEEYNVLNDVINNSKHPLTVIISGAKMKTKVWIIERFLDKADNIIIGGGIANTFLAALWNEVGESLYDFEEIIKAKRILNKDVDNKIIIPEDVIVAKDISENSVSKNILISEVEKDDKILDLWENTIKNISEKILNSKMVLWNWPVGLFEIEQFSKGTIGIAQAMKDTLAKTIIWWGDTINAIKKSWFKEYDFSHISTGGGASLKYLWWGVLPGINVLLN